MTDQQIDAWASYLVPGDAPALANVAGLTAPAAIVIFDRIVSAQAAQALLAQPDYDATFDLAHLQAVHQRLFTDVYPFAGQLRYVDLKKPDQPDDGFVHHAWVAPYVDSVVAQLRREGNLTSLHDPGQWSDRAAYYLNALDKAHPFRDGNGRASRIWASDLAHAAGHRLDWTKASAATLVHTAHAAQQGDLEPSRALLTHLTNGTAGVDRPIQALNDLDGTLTREAWARTGLRMGTPSQQALIEAQVPALDTCLAAILAHLTDTPDRATSREQPAAQRWAGLAAAFEPTVPAGADWDTLAAALDRAHASGYRVPERLQALVSEPLDAGSPARDLHRRLLEDCDAAIVPAPARSSGPAEVAATASAGPTSLHLPSASGTTVRPAPTR